jgi:hypothetical protein
MAVRALRQAVDAYHDADDQKLGRAIADGERVLGHLEPYGEVFVEPAVRLGMTVDTKVSA